MILELAQSPNLVLRGPLSWAVADLARHMIDHDKGKQIRPIRVAIHAPKGRAFSVERDHRVESAHVGF
jgi:hypothetical protein